MHRRATGIADHILPLGDLLYFVFRFCLLLVYFSRGHATLHLAVSVAPSVRQSLGRSHFCIVSGFCITAPAQPSAPVLLCIRPCFFLPSISPVISCGHATQHLAVTVGKSVGNISELQTVFALLPLPNRPRLFCRVSGLVAGHIYEASST